MKPLRSTNKWIFASVCVVAAIWMASGCASSQSNQRSAGASSTQPVMASDTTAKGGAELWAETCSRCRGSGQLMFQQGFFRISRPCDACGGAGEVVKERCPTCRGAGRVESQQSLSVKIPAGVDTGSRLKLRGEGEAGGSGGPAGDLYVLIQVAEHPIFVREGNDVICEVPMSFAQIALGAEIDVPTLNGPAKVKVWGSFHPSTSVVMTTAFGSSRSTR